MTIADDIVSLVKRKHRLKLTEQDIAEILFGENAAYQQRVNSTCRRLIADGVLERVGNGGPADPFTYRIPLRRRV